MADQPDILSTTDLSQFGDIAGAIGAFAWTHGITADPDPIDSFVADVTRLCDQNVAFDRTEMLLLKIARAGLVDDAQRFALHAAYLRQQNDGVRSVL